LLIFRNSISFFHFASKLSKQVQNLEWLKNLAVLKTKKRLHKHYGTVLDNLPKLINFLQNYWPICLNRRTKASGCPTHSPKGTFKGLESYTYVSYFIPKMGNEFFLVFHFTTLSPKPLRAWKKFPRFFKQQNFTFNYSPCWCPFFFSGSTKYSNFVIAFSHGRNFHFQ
jgi:hypothetical protein